MKLHLLLSGVSAALLFVGCSSTTQIETSPPRTREAASETSPESTSEARLAVFFQEGDTDLPDEVSKLRFRIAEVHLQQRGGEWVRLPSDLNLIEIDRGRDGIRKTVLDTRVPPAEYDSLALSFDRVYLEFGANAGGPLTVAAGAPHRMALGLRTALGLPISLILRFEPGASLTRSSDCRWFFVPLLRPEIQQESSASDQG
ncbi:MAG: hypothetical protein WED81_06590 [Rhodothermales bacterium]